MKWKQKISESGFYISGMECNLRHYEKVVSYNTYAGSM